MHFKRQLLVAVLVVVVVLAGARVLSATCPTAPNGSFDTNTSGWNNYSAFASSLGDPPGSDEVGPVTANTSTTCGDAYSDCLPIAPGDECTLSAEGHFEYGSPTNATSFLEYLYFSDNSCASLLNLSSPATLSSSTQGVWAPMVDRLVTAPATAHSVRLVYNLCAQPGTSVTSYFDNVVSETVIFADGFESDDTSAWSVTV